MILNFANKRKSIDGRLLIQKEIFGFGARLNLKSAECMRQIDFVFELDLFCIRFWMIKYKSSI